ncbi:MULTISPECIES: type II toxin-antitoxin system RelB/DinJ family antitoxin [Latilactobacillus]|uniref:type II toxin-antitoxin system RelB/DinJ family antitoxin n=1 Tax=Latilactobacillus TaxID=2767885 RepID=UPI000B5E86C7|nr:MULTISPECIES: type II toxin-antitoxin system RelB/DinJ family antitoxin [Latilactobacillus]ASN13598.1 hypothetical protein B4V05_10220 [Latilactobacillus sakei]MCW8780636.1 type II toxin-antitoxin system RelB/DinJ family antitoxin [Latilactobacillus curvatus]
MNGKDKKRVQVQIDRVLTTETEEVLNALGLTPTTVITMLYRRIAANGALPFKAELTAKEMNKIKNNNKS